MDYETRLSCFDVVAKLMDWVPVPGSKECHADRNSNEMCTLQSEERGMWEETPSGKAQVGGEATCIGATCARTDVEYDCVLWPPKR
jgi:hypothetical protein